MESSIMESKARPLVSVVIPTLNEQQYIASCLRSVLNCRHDDFDVEVIVVDNGSTDSTLDIVKQHPVRLYQKTDCFVGAVRNYGAEKGRGEILCFLDSDCVVRNDWLENGVAMLQGTEVSAVGGSYITREQPNWVEKYWVLNGGYSVTDGIHLVGGCIFVERQAYDAVGGFDESLNSGEDYEFTEDLRAKQYRVDIKPDINLVHMGNPQGIESFVKRQIWHSADYITKLPYTLKDKVFLLTLIYLVSFLSGVLSSLLLLPPLLVSSFYALFIFCPIVLSIKRIKRSQARYGFSELLKIYTLDHLYLIGRILGIAVSAKNAVLSPSKKVNRR